MSRRILGLCLAAVLGAALSGCPGQGTHFSGDEDQGAGASDAMADVAVLEDGVSGGDDMAADAIPGADTVAEVSEDVLDAVLVDLPLDGASDLSSDAGADSEEPPAPWAPCSQAAPCAGGGEICLLLPGEEATGVCVVPCVPGGDDCPPSQGCVVPDPEGAPDTGYCFLPTGQLEPCDASAGHVCTDGRSCLAPLAGGVAVCTDFCVAEEALCPDMTSCAPVTEEGVAEGWGACLPVEPAVPCLGDLGCTTAEVCVSPGVGGLLCLPSCDTPGVPCATGGTCTLADGPGGAVTACLHHQGAAEWCDPLRGWVCADDRTCLDVGDPTGFGRCAGACDGDVDCVSHEVCVAGSDSGGAATLGCLPPSLAGPPLPACDPSWPCAAPAVCVDGACVAPCADGCPGGQSCVDDGCVHQSPMGHACAPGWGWLCADGGTCAKDTKAESGVCTTACGGDGDCPPDMACLAGPGDEALCLTPVGFGSACAFSLGTACADDGYCMFLGSGAAGFCSAACPGIGQGGCPAGPAGTLSDCMLNTGGQTWCAFLCGPFGAECPGEMTCDASGVCLP